MGAGLALTACTGSPENPGDSTGPPSSAGGQSPTGETPSAPANPPSVLDGEFLRDATCAADDSGSWSFEADLVNDQDHARTFTVALAVTVGMEVKGHDMIVQEVPANSEEHVSRNYFAQTDDKNAVCEPVVSAEG